MLCSHNRCVLVFLQLLCGAWSAVKFMDDKGPKPIFLRSYPDGVRTPQGALADGVDEALAMVERGVKLAEAVLSRGKGLIGRAQQKPRRAIKEICVQFVL